MNIPIQRKRLWRYFVIATCLLLLLSLSSGHFATACSWGYPIWMIRSESADPLYRFVRNGKAGYIDRSGKIILEPRFDFYGNFGGEFHDGLLQIGVSRGQYIDMTGKLVINKNLSSSGDFSEGLAAAIPKGEKKFGYIDHSGEFVISPRFAQEGYVHSFSEGLAAIQTAKRFGYIDRSGEFVIPPAFLHGTDFHEGMARVVIEGPCVYYGTGPCRDARVLPEGKLGQAPPCKFTFIDKFGSILTAERFDYAKDFSEGLAPVKVEGKWGYIDKQGQIAIKPRFDNVEPFSDGLARVQQSGRYGYIDHTGAFTISPQYRYAEAFSEGVAVVGGNWNERKFEYEEFYYIDKQGKQAIPERFALASHFFKGLAHVKLKSNEQKSEEDSSDRVGQFAYIDITGKRVFTYEVIPK